MSTRWLQLWEGRGERPLSEVYNADTNLSNLFTDADGRNILYSCNYTSDS
jgi:hypothetical protein